MADPAKQELREKILAKLNTPTLCSLATVREDGKPWVRYVTLFADRDLNLWMATFIQSRKVGQIQKNREVHLTTGDTDPQSGGSYLQIQGRAEILTDEATKKAVWFDPLKNIFSGPEDPKYAVCRIVPYRIEIQPMGPVPPQVWEG